MYENLSRSLKVSVVTTWPPYRDGISLYSARLYKKIANFLNVEIIANKIEACDTPKSYVGGGGKIVVSRCWGRGTIFCPFQIICQAIKSRAHIVHFHYGWLLYGFITTPFIPFSLLILHLLRRSVVLTLHTVIQRNAKIYNMKFLNSLANFTIFVLTRLLTKFSSRIIVHNSLMKKVLERNYGCESQKIAVIPHGVVKAKLEDRNRKHSDNTLKILSLGFLREEKKLECLLEVFSNFSIKNPEARLFIIGGRHPHDKNRYLEKIKKLIFKLKLENRVYLMNFVSEKELDKLIHDCDFIVLTSTKDYFVETSGALTRVADFNKPVICTTVTKFRSELKNGYDCLMFSPENGNELMNAMHILVKDKNLGRQLALNLKKHFETRYWSNVAKAHVDLYTSLLNFKENIEQTHNGSED